MLSTKLTPLRPSINGMVKPKYSSNNKLTEPFYPNKICIATAPTNCGMIRGIIPKVWTRAVPPKLNRVVKNDNGMAMIDATTTDIDAR